MGLRPALSLALCPVAAAVNARTQEAVQVLARELSLALRPVACIAAWSIGGPPPVSSVTCVAGWRSIAHSPSFACTPTIAHGGLKAPYCSHQERRIAVTKSGVLQSPRTAYGSHRERRIAVTESGVSQPRSAAPCTCARTCPPCRAGVGVSATRQDACGEGIRGGDNSRRGRVARLRRVPRDRSASVAGDRPEAHDLALQV